MKKTRKKYTRYKNIFSNLLRYEKKSYYSKQLDLYKTDIQKTWKVINEVFDIFLLTTLKAEWYS